jgi:predicted Zn-dependent peptidase
LSNIKYSDLLAHYAEMLGGDRLIISVSGDFDANTMRESLMAAFGEWRPASQPLPSLDAATKAAGGSVYLIDKPAATQTYFYIGNVGVARGFGQRAELDLANTVFGGRFTSMLVTELRTKSGLSYSARSILTRYAQPGAVFISSFTETGTTVAALDVALATLAKLRSDGLDAAMIESARNYVMGQFPPRLETARQLAGTFAMLEANGLDASYINDYGASLLATTPESVAAVINNVYPSSEDLVFIVIGDAELIREQLSAYGSITEVPLSAPSFHP